MDIEELAERQLATSVQVQSLRAAGIETVEALVEASERAVRVAAKVRGPRARRMMDEAQALLEDEAAKAAEDAPIEPEGDDDYAHLPDPEPPEEPPDASVVESVVPDDEPEATSPEPLPALPKPTPQPPAPPQPQFRAPESRAPAPGLDHAPPAAEVHPHMPGVQSVEYGDERVDLVPPPQPQVPASVPPQPHVEARLDPETAEIMGIPTRRSRFAGPPVDVPLLRELVRRPHPLEFTVTQSDGSVATARVDERVAGPLYGASYDPRTYAIGYWTDHERGKRVRGEPPRHGSRPGSAETDPNVGYVTLDMLPGSAACANEENWDTLDEAKRLHDERIERARAEWQRKWGKK